MRRVSLLTLAVVFLIACSCGESSEQNGEAIVCRTTLSNLAQAELLHFAKYGNYTSSLSDLDEFNYNASETVCPSCGSTYRLTSDGESYTIACPCEEHGSIVDGIRSWVEVR